MGANLFMRISNDMKKFVLKATLFVLTMVLVDFLSGLLFSELNSHAKGGNTRLNYYLANECDADVLVMGSSRALHHYVPQIVDSLGGKAYNLGGDGMGVILSLGRYRLCAENKIPKIVILDISSFDYVKDDKSKYLKFLRPYGDREKIRNIISQIGEPFLQLKMMSNMYRNTSRIIHNIGDLFVQENLNYRGYKPIFKTCQNCDETTVFVDDSSFVLDSVKLNIFDQFVNEVSRHGAKLYLSVSPVYSFSRVDKLPILYAYAEELSKKYNVPLINNFFVQGISDDANLFSDATHLNNDGAIAFSHKFIKDVLILQKEEQQ